MVRDSEIKSKLVLTGSIKNILTKGVTVSDGLTPILTRSADSVAEVLPEPPAVQTTTVKDVTSVVTKNSNMGVFKKIGEGIKAVLKNVPIVGNVVSAADAVYKAVKSTKASSKTSVKTAAVGEKIAAADRWFAWAPNWVIIVSGVGLLAVLAYAIFGKRRRRRR